MRTTRCFLMTATVLLTAGCGARDLEDDPLTCGGLDKVRGPSESCCPAYGIDACGAGLFCAAFDGRTIATCYVNNVRRASETCAADGHCLSGTCARSGKCAAGLADTCNSTDGCAPRGGKAYACADGECVIADGRPYCTTDQQCVAANDSRFECRSGQCVDKTLKNAGDACQSPTECVVPNCFQGRCQCLKQDNSGCASGLTCTGSSHVTYGNRCQ